MAHGGSASLRVQYDIAPQEWVDFGRDLEGLEDWSAGSGLSLWVRSDTLNRMGTLMIFSGDADNPTPFEAGFGVAGDETWAPLTFEWADLTRAEWADEGGLAEIDPARITGYGFSLAAGDERVEGTLWVDDVSLITGEEPPIIAPGPADTPIVEPGEEDEPGRPSICAGATALPLGALGILVLRHHRRRGEGKDR